MSILNCPKCGERERVVEPYRDGNYHCFNCSSYGYLPPMQSNLELPMYSSANENRFEGISKDNAEAPKPKPKSKPKPEIDPDKYVQIGAGLGIHRKPRKNK